MNLWVVGVRFAEEKAEFDPNQVTPGWEGFVFINPDPDAGPLEEFLGPVCMAHYKKYGFEESPIQPLTLMLSIKDIRTSLL